MAAPHLEKEIDPESLRGHGSLHKEIDYTKIPIGATGISILAEFTGGSIYAIDSVSIEDVLVLNLNEIYLIYVRPDYRYYRNIAHRYMRVEESFHVDHVLAKSLANELGAKYVLLEVLPRKINLKHGSREKGKNARIGVNSNGLPRVFKIDGRIRDKMMGFDTTSRFPEAHFPIYNEDKLSDNGFTLKQRGQVCRSLRLHIKPLQSFVDSLRPYNLSLECQ